MSNDPTTFCDTIVGKMVDLIAKNFDLSESTNGFWVKTKPRSEFPRIYCPLESKRFSCWLKYQALSIHNRGLTDNRVAEIVELTVGQNVAHWCQSTDVTHAIESDITVEAITSWVDQQRRSSGHHAGISESPFKYVARFETFYSELMDFAIRNHLGNRGSGKFPGSSSVLSRKLSEQAETLLAAGICVVQPPRDKYGAKVEISLTGDELAALPSLNETSASVRSSSGTVTGDGGDAWQLQIRGRLGQGEQT